MRTTIVTTCCWLTLVAVAVVAGCDDETSPSANTAATGTPTAEATGGAAPAPDRGDPDEFPADCVESCAEACANLSSCGGDSSLGFPLEEADCLDRCDSAEGGDYWDDLSGNFKCCTAQTDCFAVAHCGGWLKHPDTEEACQWYCDCRYQNGLAALAAGREPPEGYRFAPDVVLVDPGPTTADLSLVRGVRVLREGRKKLVRLESAATQATVADLAHAGLLLPTFLDPRGRVSAATGDLILIVAGAPARAKALATADRLGLGHHRRLRTRLSRQPDAELYLLEGSDPWRSLDAWAELNRLPGVTAELDQLRYYERRYVPNDPMYGDQWHLRNTGQSGSTPSVDGRVSEAWDVTRGDAQVIIAINDDGVDLNHPELAGKLEAAQGFPADWEAQMSTSMSFGWHGSSVAGVAAAKADNDEGGAGVCPDCRVLPHLLAPLTEQGGFEPVTDSHIAQGFEEMVDAGAWVINNSWGPSVQGLDPIYADVTGEWPAIPAVVAASFDYAETTGRGGLGTVIVFAAGNSNFAIDSESGYETVVSVTGIDDLGLKPYYSSFGPEADVAAPTSGGLNGITTTSNESDYTDSFGGTSSASPFVAGVMGLILSANPSLTAGEARGILQDSATKIDPVFGAWNVDGHSDFHGAGLVNAYAAVQLASGACATPQDCVAPSDDCGSSCATGISCDPCRTHADCAADHVCQALPSLGRLVCVAAVGAGSCAAGTTEVNGYCLPSRPTCGLCGAAEACNGRDDDCNGAVDDGDVCEGGPLCFIDAPGCAANEFCAGRHCMATCTADAECGTNATCVLLKDQYGAAPGAKGCSTSGGGYASRCYRRCEVRASSLADEDLVAFLECTEYGQADCSLRQQCRELLP
ncbi:MAG: S8 family serine peptidase [Deltaproteobacteria bacterium]|jgi:subtilisin family serine protease|nr:S8 family serine peptidase [Deltaproteobacteria bacterium]MBW2534550.1 S8 family serine peptidase [Deltaproteobacteria bacterium]